MATEPVDYQIVQAVQTALQAIDDSDGVSYVKMPVGAVRLDPDVDVDTLLLPDGPRPFALIEVLADRRVYRKYNDVKITLPLRVHWVDDVDQTDDSSRIRTFLRAVADVERAVRSSQAGALGALAIESLVTDRELVPMDGGRMWAVVSLEIEYERPHGQP